MQINDEVLKSLSNEHNLPIAQETYQDLGKSAYKGEHLQNELGLFLSAVKSDTVAEGSILVVYSLDRLSRLEIGHAKQTYYDLTNNGVSVYALVDNHLYRAHNAADDIIATITFERAHNESKDKSHRVIDAAKQALKLWKDTGEPQGALGRPPFWIDQSTNSFNVNAKGAKKAIEMKIEGYGDLRIKNFLDAHYDYKPTRRERRVKTALTWDLGVINQLWGRRSLIGEKTYTIEGRKHVLEGYYPSLIDDYTFQQLTLQTKKKEGRTTASGRIPLLKGITRCGVCGGAMNTGDKGGVRQHYVCNQASKSEHPREIYNANVLEILTLHICRDAYLTESINANDTEFEQKRIQLETELFEQRNSLDSLLKRYKARPNETYLDLIDDSEDKIAALEEDLAALHTRSVVFSAEEISGLSEVFSDEVRTDQKHPMRLEIKNNLRRFISSIVFSRNRLPSSHSKTGLAECIDITWNFTNGQKRRLAMLPFEYVKSNDGRRELFLPFVYTYGSNSPMEVNRDRGLIYKAIEKLHARNLTSYLYPSKGRYQWEGLSLIQGVPFWTPLDSAWFHEGNTYFFTDKSTSSDISLLFNYWPTNESISDLPESLFCDLSSIFGFSESPDFFEILSDHYLDQELSAAIDDGLFLS